MTATTRPSPLAALGVTVTVGDATLLDDVTLSALPGQVLALVGPNGAGKSTLLRVLAGELAPARGHVELDGVRLDRIPTVEAARTRAVHPQDPVVSFPFTVREITRMGRAPWTTGSALLPVPSRWRRTAAAPPTTPEREERIVTGALSTAQVLTLTERTFPTLSGGEKARATFARVLAQTAPVLLLDEPTAALDVRHQEHLLGVLRRAADTGATVVVVLHDLTLAAAYSDRVALLRDGRLHSVGEPADVLTGPVLTRVYEHPVEVLRHDLGEGEELIVVPRRAPVPATTPGDLP